LRKGIYIIVFINEKLVILSAPKTRTTSLLAALEPHASIMFRDPPGVKNINLAEYQRQICKMLENLSDGPFENIGIVRHPLDRMSSWYRYRQRDQLKGHRNSTHGMHTGNAGEKERKNCDVNPDPLPMPHDVKRVYGQNQSDQTRRNQGNAKPIWRIFNRFIRRRAIHSQTKFFSFC
jgi:hypothetical protein